MTYFWTPENVEKLVELHAKALSFREIAAVIGVTRNAVAGKASRLGLESNRLVEDPFVKIARLSAQREEKLARRRIRARQNVRKVKRPRKVTPADVLARESLNVSFADLERHQCRYPYGDDPASFTFCGHPRHDLSSYCEGHTSLCCREC